MLHLQEDVQHEEPGPQARADPHQREAVPLLRVHQNVHQPARRYQTSVEPHRREEAIWLLGLHLTKSEVAKHPRVHPGERPYPCSICTKMFTAKGSVTTHERTQHNARA